ncbi:MAG: DUF1553 domain-containing protein, partial [Verrucomicrobiota bacterium]
LILLNDPQFVEAARILGTELCNKHGEASEALVAEAYRRLTSRQPTAEELEILVNLFLTQLKEFEADAAAAAEVLKVGDAAQDELVPAARAAAATVLCNTIMNLDESLIER